MEKAQRGGSLQSMSEWVKSLSRVWLSATPWTVAYQVPPSMGFSRQEYWSGFTEHKCHFNANIMTALLIRKYI